MIHELVCELEVDMRRGPGMPLMPADQTGSYFYFYTVSNGTRLLGPPNLNPIPNPTNYLSRITLPFENIPKCTRS